MADAEKERIIFDEKRFVKYVKIVNKLGEEMMKLEQEIFMTITPPDSWIRDITWKDYVNEFLEGGIELWYDSRYGSYYFKIPLDHAKNWGYLTRVLLNYSLLYITGELDLMKILALYKAYREGLLKEIIAGLERALQESKRREPLLKKAILILEMMGIPRE